MKWVTKMLLFSLIPLHDTKEMALETGDAAADKRARVQARCRQYFKLGQGLEVIFTSNPWWLEDGAAAPADKDGDGGAGSVTVK